MSTYDHNAYWCAFYKANVAPSKPSSFAQYVYNTHVASELASLRIADIGCGNRRDSHLFVTHGHIVTCVDPAQPPADPTPYVRICAQSAEKAICIEELGGLQDVFYMRWFIHSVSHDEGTLLLQKAYGLLKPGGLMCIEVRSENDAELIRESTSNADGSHTTDHKRWLWSVQRLQRCATNMGAESVSLGESHGWSKTANSDPLLIRCVLKRPLINHFVNSPNYTLLAPVIAKCRHATIVSNKQLAIFNKVMEKLGIQYFAVAGALLGAIRHGGLAPWDDDIDLGFTDENFDKLVDAIPELEAVGLIRDEFWDDEATATGFGAEIAQWTNRDWTHIHFGLIDCFRLNKHPTQDVLTGLAGTVATVASLRHIVKQKFGPTYIYCPIECIDSLVYRYGPTCLHEIRPDDNYHADYDIKPLPMSSHDYAFSTDE
jgi:hypothetical protein